MKVVYSAVCLLGAAAISISAQTQPSPRAGEVQIERGIFMPNQESGGYLGVEPKDVTKDNFASFGLPDVKGVAIERVFENSPAAKAGLQKGDVIVRFGGDMVSSSRKLQRLVGEVAPDHSVDLTVVRGGKEINLKVTVGKREGVAVFDGDFGPMSPGEGRTFEFRVPRIEGLPRAPEGNVERRVTVRTGERRVIGVGVAPLTEQLGSFFGINDGKGLLVNEVRENSPAAKAGIKAGDVIVQADGAAVSENEQLVDALNAKKEGEVTLTLVRGKKRETVKVAPETVKEDGATRRVEEIIIDGPVGAEPARPLRRMLIRPLGNSGQIRPPAPIM